jgi:hypothetical protein
LVEEVLMQRFFKVAFLFLALSGWAWAQAGWVATPGVGVGELRLGMTASAIEKMVTRSSRTDHQEVSGKPKWIYYNEGVQVHYDDAVKALQIVVDKPGIKTPEGLQVGDPSSQISALYGRAGQSHQLPTAARMSKQYYYVFTSRGLGVQTEGDRVLLIYIFPAR